MTEPEIKVKQTTKRLYDPLPKKEKDSGTEEILPEPSDRESKEACANKIIRKYAALSMGTALVPIPLLDMAACTGLQLRMIQKLGNHYGTDFSKNRGKIVLGSLIGGFHVGLAGGSLLKVVPLVGMTYATASMVAVSGAVTYAVGKVFVQHFETGGTMLDFNPSKFKKSFARHYEEGRQKIE